EEGRYGLCATPAEPADFADKILALLGDAAAAGAMATRAAQRARGFDARAVAEAVFGRYDALAAARRRAR
ncbi:MAG TPA: glycosyltransferase family 1 protein, partial [Polyangia bacterium]|nr:glycosyltransferase family 1 protein [Polyangia bacterium]